MAFIIELIFQFLFKVFFQIFGELLVVLGCRGLVRGMSVMRLDTFSYGFIFAFSMEVIRYKYAG